MMEGLQIPIPQRMTLVRITLVLSLIISILLSYPLWFGQRNFPLTPLIEIDQLPSWLDYIYIASAILFWIASLLLKKQRVFIFFGLSICVWMAMLDITRVQPWFYIYNSLLAVFLFYDGRVDDPNKYTTFFIILQIIVASVYFFSGLSQLNDSFAPNQFTVMISPLKEMISERQFQLFVKLGVLVPYILMFIGIALIISPIRYLAISLAILVHLSLIIFLFPSASHTNYALWFSNITFTFLLFFLFNGKTKQRYFSPTFLFQKPLFYLVLGLFVIMPFLNQRDLWPDFLSSNFKSGSNKRVEIIIDEKVFRKLPLYERHFYKKVDQRYLLNYDHWCNEELYSDCFPHEKVFNSIYRYLLGQANADVKEIELKYLPSNGLLRKP